MRAARLVACPREAPVVCASRAAPPGLDPVHFLGIFPARQRFLWEQPAAGVAIAAVGAALAFRATPASRLGPAATDWPVAGEEPLLVGGFAFDPTRAPDGIWHGTPAAEWCVPHLALVRRRGETQLVAADTAPRAAAVRVDRALTILTRPAVLTCPASRPMRYRVAAMGTADDWRHAVEDTLADIAVGRLAKLVLARAGVVEADVPFDPLRVVRQLRRAHRGCTVFLVSHGATTFVGATPERLVRVDGDRVETEAVAGSVGRGDEAEADRALARGLLASAKERAEHELVRRDLATRLRPLCETLRAAPAPRVRPTRPVQHLWTPIRGRLRAGTHLLDVTAALHPTAAVCGTPRLAAQRALRTREATPRGWYGGGVGWMDRRGGEIAVAIRTALLRGPRAVLHAGAGIVAGSEWEAELEETRLKMWALLGTLLEV
jgi:isochorismate synthase